MTASLPLCIRIASLKPETAFVSISREDILRIVTQTGFGIVTMANTAYKSNLAGGVIVRAYWGRSSTSLARPRNQRSISKQPLRVFRS